MSLIRPTLAALAAAVALAATGCAATTSAEPGANSYFDEHWVQIDRAAAAARAIEAAVAAVPAAATRAQREALAVAARRARRAIAPATEWQVTESGEEEDLGQAELEVNEGAGSLLKAIAALTASARRPGELGYYRADLAAAREHWNQGTHELWYLAHEKGPPDV